MQNDKLKFKNEFKQRLYEFTLKLIEFIDKLPGDNVARRLSDQLLRSGTSVLANYTEGQAVCSRKDFINYFQISLKSANESRIWLQLLRDAKRAEAGITDPLLNELSENANIFASSILTLKGRK